jgi:RNA polymerase sigma factor (sigma-70 family)
MRQFDTDTTSASLLARVASLANQPAWAEFIEYYNPRLRRWCGLFSLNGELADELCQRIWIELMRRMPSYRYDPGKSFRGWLWFLFRSRAINLLKERNRELADLADSMVLDLYVSGADPVDDEPDGRMLLLLQLGEEIHETVRDRVNARRWEAYWRIVIEGEDVGETATKLGMSYAAAYAAARNVDGMVRAEGRRRLDRTTSQND